jgi:hypothetical protein
MADVPHFALPIRLRAGRFLATEQGSRRHLEDQAEVVLRTRPGTLEADPTFGLRDLVGRAGAVTPEVLAALERYVGADFEATGETLERLRRIGVSIVQEDEGEGG